MKNNLDKNDAAADLKSESAVMLCSHMYTADRMKIVIAPDSFKGSLSAAEVCGSIEEGINRVLPDAEIIKVPMADGGEGTKDALIEATHGRRVKVKVKDPLWRDIDAEYGVLGDGVTAVIEMAEASGLTLLNKNELNPLKTTTYGTGQLIAHAMKSGCRKFIIGIGGSATNDGGIGMASALGFRFLDENGNELEPTGGNLMNIKSADCSNVKEEIKNCRFRAACDVDNVLCGPDGAANVYGRQKGADDDAVILLDRGLENYANVLKRCIKADVRDIPGAGAAGGMGAGIVAFLGGTLESGVDIVMEASDLKDKMKNADLVFTGEGKIDCQTLRGKVPFGVAQSAKPMNIPVAAICGSVGENYRELYKYGFTSILSIAPGPITLDECIKSSPALIADAAEAVVRLKASV